MTQSVLKKTKLPEHVKSKILKANSSEGAPASYTAPIQGGLKDATKEPTPRATPNNPAAQPKLTLKSITGLMARLDDQRLLYVLKQMPPHLLARALDQILADGTTSVVKSNSTNSSETDADILDKRNAERTETDQIGKIIYNNLMSVTDCKIADLSSTGCRITIESILGVPECFTLQIGNGGTKRECKVIWRKHYEMGIKFIA